VSGEPPTTSGVDPTSSTYGFAGYSRKIEVDSLVNLVRNSLPKLLAEALDDVDPGYFDVPKGTQVPFTVGDADDFDGETDFPLGHGYVLSDLLVKRRIPQTLSDTSVAQSSTVVANLMTLVDGVLSRVDDAGEELPFIVDSGWMPPTTYSPDPEAALGQSVRLEFLGVVGDRVYQKAVAMAKALPFDRVSLDYDSTGKALVTVLLSPGKQDRRLTTRYDDRVISTSKLINASPDSDVEDVEARLQATLESEADDYFSPDDDFSALARSIAASPETFGGLTQSANLLKTFGFSPNRFLSGLSGTSPGAGGSPTKGSLTDLSAAVQCPEVKRNAKLFPIGSNPGHRQLTDLTQMDDSDTQDVSPLSVRANNPLKVKKVTGVTDLKTRFGYLGEADGFAVYRDHVGGAAAGLNYLMQNAGGSTMGGGIRKLLGDYMGKDALSASKLDDDVSAPSAARVFQNVSEDLFGVKDPTGVTNECATINEDDMESMISYAASLSKTLASSEWSTLTHDEWASAYQIAKNEANEHVSKTTTGVSLPAQEESNTVDTGVKTASQGRETRNTVDKENRGQNETWNPVNNYDHYANTLWSQWISDGLITYEKKTSNTDTTRVAKLEDTEAMSQDKAFRNGNAVLPWNVKTG
jgi:hypothetical protein